MYWSVSPRLAVASIAHGLTVWLLTDQHFTWRHDNQDTIWPVNDTHGAAAHLAKLIDRPQP
jgi:hypothetical protein